MAGEHGRREDVHEYPRSYVDHLQLHGCRAQTGYKYQAVFTNGAGAAATTSAATLTVNAPAATPTVQIDAGGGAAGSYSADADTAAVPRPSSPMPW